MNGLWKNIDIKFDIRNALDSIIEPKKKCFFCEKVSRRTESYCKRSKSENGFWSFGVEIIEISYCRKHRFKVRRLIKKESM